MRIQSVPDVGIVELAVQANLPDARTDRLGRVIVVLDTQRMRLEIAKVPVVSDPQVVEAEAVVPEVLAVAPVARVDLDVGDDGPVRRELLRGRDVDALELVADVLAAVAVDVNLVLLGLVNGLERG